RRRRRFKIRTRTYVDSGKCWLEVKTRGSRGSTVKNRIPYSLGHTTTLAPGRTFVDSILTRDSIPGSSTMTFLPTLTTQYRRTTLFIPETLSRATIDTELMWEDPEHRRLRMPDRAIVETKTGSSPSGVDRLLWSRGYRPIRISKYATGLAALRPDLPSSRWQRTLRRHFACAGPPGMPMAFNWFNASCREPASCEQGSWQ
ncbi:MAG: VTC domain-containing protein, partial [Micromonosporaceae bacterium]|nr:VTC domain-containing protein [Micromonosporaceae bacterium]